MSTPSSFPTQIPLTQQPVQVWAGGRAASSQVTFINLDNTNTVFIGTSSSISPGGGNTIPIASFGSITLPGAQTLYGCTDELSGSPANLLVAGGAINYAPSPAQVAASIDLTALATAIALAIEQSGIPLIASPVQLYDVPATTIAGAGPVGATTQPLGYNQCLGTSYDTLGVANYVDGFLIGNPALKFQKWFIGQDVHGNGKWITSAGNIPNGLQELITAGCQILLCVQPNTVFSSSEFTGLQNTIKILFQAGCNLYGVAIWQEPNTDNKFPNGAAWGTLMGQYAPALVTTAGTANFVACMATNISTGGNYQEYFNAIPNTVTVYALTADLYGNSFINQGIFLDAPFGAATLSFEQLADNYGCELGLSEWGVAQASTVGIIEADWVLFWQKVQNFFLTRLNNGKVNGPISWYSGTNSPEYDLLPNMPCLPPNSITTGYDVTAGLNTIFTTLSNASQTVSIAPSATLTLPPINPSPNAKFAPSQTLSYELNFSASIANTSTNPFAEVIVQFFETDNPNAVPLDTIRWIVPMSADAGGSQISGRGPLRGQYMSVQVKNLDTVLTCSVGLNLSATSRPFNIARDVWQEATNFSVPGFTRPTRVPGTDMLGTVNFTAAPSTTTDTLFPLWNGKLWFALLESGVVAPNLTVNAQPMPAGFFGSPNVTNDYPAGANSPVQYEYYSPRCCLRVRVINNGTANASVNFALVAAES